MALDNDIFTENYDRFNDQQQKKIGLVITIDGVPFLFSNRPLFTRVRYGDPGFIYGQPTLIYGGLIRLEGVEDILSLQGSSMTLSQKIEPEQGKGSASTLNFAFVDKDLIMTRLFTPGEIVDDIMGKAVTVELGYEEISYPQDYRVIFRGIVTSISWAGGLAVMQFSDPNIKRKQKQIFFTAKTPLALSMDDSQVTATLVAAGDFHDQIQGPDGSVDPAVKTYLKIDDELMEYGFGDINFGINVVTVTRGARGTAAETHDVNSDVSAVLELTDHAIDMALKLMLSGFNGFWKTGEPLRNINETGNKVSFPIGVDVRKKYGLAIGSFFTIEGSLEAGNNAQFIIVDIQSPNDLDKNNDVILDGPLTTELDTTATVSFRSTFDTYPVSAGMKLDPNEVDIDGHIDVKNVFLGDIENSYNFLITDADNGKSFIEREIYLPVSGYSITRFGRLSFKVTKPPIADQTLVILNQDNILDPARLRLSRAVNSRKFFNEIVYQFDFDDEGDFINVFRFLDTDSLNIIGMSSVLEIKSKGMRSSILIDATQRLTRNAQFLLSRYRFGAQQIRPKINWGAGNKIEAGDVVALDGDGLQLSNWKNATNVFGIQLFEVVDRKLNIKTGQVTLSLIAGVGSDINDRFATISPSSLLDAGSTISKLRIKDSFSESDPAFPNDETRKWVDYIGLPIRVHNDDYTFDEETIFLGFDEFDDFVLDIDPPLSAPPPEDHVIDIVPYTTGTDSSVNALYKVVHAHLSPTVLVDSGASDTVFDVTLGEEGKFLVGGLVRIHNADFTIDSVQRRIESVVGQTVTVDGALGFTPAAGQFIELIGFPDGGGAYRMV